MHLHGGKYRGGQPVKPVKPLRPRLVMMVTVDGPHLAFISLVWVVVGSGNAPWWVGALLSVLYFARWISGRPAK